ncbi:hypothetical protein [Archangium sp.]|uniref:hypothetical protein n=1 Tax=Archangium sp. TaxID=1872627 RepID=UPI00286C74FE|nr:hypothetical protein [Archangium sp.]
MRKAQGARSLRALVVASCLLASLSAAGGDLTAFERNGKASLQRALDTLEPLVASPAEQGLTATVSALREASRHAFFDASRVHDAQLLERALRLREELQSHPAASSAVSDLLLLVQQAAFVSVSDARLLFDSPPSPVHASRVAKGVAAFREAERAWEEASQQLARGQERQAGPSLLRAWREALEAMGRAGVDFRPGEVSDVDGDGVPDQLEVRFGASPLSVDTDGDGLTDGFELRWGGAHLLPASADTDGDGLADGAEDLDGDGRTSLQEQARGTDPLQSDARVDTLATAPRGTARPTPKVLAVALPGAGKSQPFGATPDPFDTDGDGLDDVAELANSTPPDVADWDGDGLSDSQELEHLTDPDVADTDGDGFSDHYEVTHLGDGLDPLAPDERLSPQQWARDYAHALALGDTCDTALSGWKPCKATVPFFLGQLSGGTASFIPVVGWVVGGLADVRDAVGNAAKGEWAGAGLSVLGVLPVVGDVGKLVGRVVEFTKRHGKLEEVLRAVLRALPKLLGVLPDKADGAARELVLAVLRKVDPEGFQTVAKYGGDEFLIQVAKLGGKWKNLAQLFTGLEKSGLFTQYPRMKEFLEEMIRTTPEEVLYGRGQVLRLNGRVTLSVKKSALRPKNGPRYLENLRKHLSSALAEHRSLSVLPGDGEDLIKVGHVASHGPDRVLRTGPFIDVLEVKAFGNVGLSHLGKWIGKRPDPENPGKFLYEFNGDMLEGHLRAAEQQSLEQLLSIHTLRYHLFIYAPDTALTRELANLFAGEARGIPIKGLEGRQIILTMTRHWD